MLIIKINMQVFQSGFAPVKDKMMKGNFKISVGFNQREIDKSKLSRTL